MSERRSKVDIFMPIPTGLLAMETAGMTAEEFGTGFLHGVKCWIAQTVGSCCPSWVRDTWDLCLSRKTRGVRQPISVSRYYGKEWPSIRSEIVKRDCTCRGCREPGPLDVHHRRPYLEFSNQRDAHQITNLVALCRKCHVAADAAYRATGEIVY